MTQGVIPTWTVGDRLAKARNVAGLTQREMAHELGTTQKTITAAETGKTNPRRQLLMAWALRTGVNLSWLETGQAPHPGGEGPVVRHQGLEPRTRCFGASAEPRRIGWAVAA